MQYFSLLAHVDGRPGRPCAMLRDATLDKAAETARHLIRNDHLPFVERRASFTLRRATRRETELLQAYLVSCGGARMILHTQEDLDGLLIRRAGLMMSFFMALYLDPHALRRRLSTTGTTDSAHKADTPGGGTTRDADQARGEAMPTQEMETARPDPEAPDLTDPSGVAAQADTVPGGDGQMAILEGILAGADDASGGAQDTEEIDILP